MINMLRMVATAHGVMAAAGEEYNLLAQQLFFYLKETEDQLLRERKRRSIPGSIPATQNGLFSASRQSALGRS